MEVVLSIAGSDSSGGAGIQADLKTFEAFGVFGCSVLTVLTAQNTRAVKSISEVSAQFVKEQLEIITVSNIDQIIEKRHSIEETLIELKDKLIVTPLNNLRPSGSEFSPR